MSAAERLIRRHRAAEDEGEPETLAWDLPTRLFKWALVVLVIAAWVSSGFADPDMTVHKAAGYGILTLLVYRVLWGFVGGSTARFASFVSSPSTVLAYVRALRAGAARRYLGHNPAGGLMILGLLAACLIQVALGLCSTDGVMASGPFADAIGDTWAARAATLHAAWFYVILGLAVVHIAVNLFYQLIKKENLIGAMITGRKAASVYPDGRVAQRGSNAVALACLGVAAALVYLGVVLPGGHFFS
ncbi:MAG TPA: cytochrome b/b6 domain-containing protein [Lichenihabitans sp.]|jgi:cytochrome b|nr:cytochrome b/b6 domain-containing protein [Lichenihabitans sp.]